MASCQFQYRPEDRLPTAAASVIWLHREEETPRARCASPASHVVLLDAARHTWGLFAADAVDRAPEFCLGCAGQVMEARNRAHRAATTMRLAHGKD